MDDHAFAEDLMAGAGAEASRLQQVVRALTERLEVARAERELLGGWTAPQLEALRQGLRMPRFGDVEGAGAELAQAQAQFDAVQALRGRLAQRVGADGDDSA